MALKVRIWQWLSISLSAVALLGAQAPVKPNFTGVWKLNLQKSKLEIPPPTATTFRIDHREPHFHLSRTHVYGKQSDTWSADLTTDGKEYYQKEGNLETWTRVYWDGDSLVLDQKIKLNGKEGTNVVRYSLADNGRTFIALERMRTPRFSHENRWVFDKQ